MTISRSSAILQPQENLFEKLAKRRIWRIWWRKSILHPTIEKNTKTCHYVIGCQLYMSCVFSGAHQKYIFLSCMTYNLFLVYCKLLDIKLPVYQYHLIYWWPVINYMIWNTSQWYLAHNSQIVAQENVTRNVIRTILKLLCAGSKS